MKYLVLMFLISCTDFKEESFKDNFEQENKNYSSQETLKICQKACDYHNKIILGVKFLDQNLIKLNENQIEMFNKNCYQECSLMLNYNEIRVEEEVIPDIPDLIEEKVEVLETAPKRDFKTFEELEKKRKK